MVQGRSRVYDLHGRLLLLSVAGLVAILMVVAAKPAESAPGSSGTLTENSSGFEYALPINPYELDGAELDRTLDGAREAGANLVAADAIWYVLNQGQPPRSYDWSSLDRLVGAAEKRGMKVSLRLHGTPDWVHPSLKTTVPDFSDRMWYPPKGSTQLGHWSNFVRDVVSRYKGRVTRYEVWNEPNIEEFWKPSPNPKEYALLLRTSYLSAKKAYPAASVAFAGLSRNDVGYLNAYYSAVKKYPGAARNRYFFDVMDVHPYSSMGSFPQEPLSPDRNTASAVYEGAYGTVDQNFLGIKKIKSAMNNRGDSGKRIFLGEYGFSSANTWMERVPDHRRALYLKRAFAQARALPYVSGMSWYAYRPTPSDGTEWSIVDDNLNPSMTYRAYKQATGKEDGNVEVSLTGEGTYSGVQEVAPVFSGLSQEDLSGQELYVDGKLAGSFGAGTIDWDTRGVTNGTHTLMVAAYTKEGSVWPSEPSSITVANGNGAIAVNSLATSASRYAAGDTVEATASISADVATEVDALTIEARPKGTTDSSLFNNFFSAWPYTIGTSPKTVTGQREISKPGTYVVWVSYYENGSWHWLNPEKEFTVG